MEGSVHGRINMEICAVVQDPRHVGREFGAGNCALDCKRDDQRHVQVAVVVCIHIVKLVVRDRVRHRDVVEVGQLGHDPESGLIAGTVLVADLDATGRLRGGRHRGGVGQLELAAFDRGCEIFQAVEPGRQVDVRRRRFVTCRKSERRNRNRRCRRKKHLFSISCLMWGLQGKVPGPGQDSLEGACRAIYGKS